jgi:hypothetical protein
MKRLICLVLLSLLSSGPASAYDKGTMGWFLDSHKIPKAAKIINERLIATVDGFTWANNFNSEKGLPNLYCNPPKLIFNGEMMFETLQRYVEDRSNKTEIMAQDTRKVGYFLMKALQEMFPCK